MTVDNRLRDVDELAAAVLRVLAQHFERALGARGLARHQDPFRLLDDCAAAERPLQVVVLAEALKGDVDRDRQLVGIIVEDVREDPTLRGFVHVRRIFRGQERDHGAGGFPNDLADQVQGVFRGKAESDERDVRPLSCGHDSDLLDVDLARDHVVPEVGDDLRQQLQAVSSFVRDQDPETLRLTDRAYLSPLAAPVFHRPKIMVARFLGSRRLLLLPAETCGAATSCETPENGPARHPPSATRAGYEARSAFTPVDKHGVSEQWRRVVHGLHIDVERRQRSPSPLTNTDVLRAVVARSPQAVVVLDRRGAVVDSNASAQSLLGRRRSELQGRRFLTLFAREERSAVGGALARAAGAQTVTHVAAADRSDGSRLLVEITSSQLSENSSGGSAQFLRDVTERL